MIPERHNYKSDKRNQSGTPGISLDQAVKEIKVFVEDSVEFQTSELEDNWSTAERYYKGETDIPTVKNRSNVVKTEVKDAIRNTMPSVMRVLLQARTPVCYCPTSVQHAPWIEQQAEYVTHLFYKCGGYMQLYQAIQEAAKLKIGILKCHWIEDPEDKYEKFTRIPWKALQELIDDPLFKLEHFEEADPVDPDVPQIPLFTVEGVRTYENGQVVIEAVPNYEFFISRNVNSIEMALDQGVHGHKTIMAVSEAIELGLDYNDWMKIDDEDPETSNHTSSSTARRGFTKKSPNDVQTVDVLQRKVLITEVYVKYDLIRAGRPQIYKFYLGGTSYKYLHHERVEDSPFSIISLNPTPFNVYGESIADLTIAEQDTSTSLLRATVDNAHAANNGRIAADPNRTSFDDIMNPALNAPIRKQSGDTMQVIQIPYTGQGNLQLLQYLDQDVQNKTGITKAAQGLDPDAMQSTDKQAVMNTIMTSQGQTELMVRNIIETGLIRAFKLLLKLSIRHQSPMQIMRTKGKVIPVNTQMFDPDAVAEPNVGLGTASPQQKMAALGFIYQEQKAAMQQYGPNNPFTSFAQIYNSLEDMIEAQGVHNVGRYFNVVTPEVEKAWAEAQEQAKQAAQEEAKKNAPIDPTKAFLQVETHKLQVKQTEIATTAAHKAEELRFKSLLEQERADIERDRLVQQRFIELAKIEQVALSSKVKSEQDTNDTKRVSAGSDRSSEKASE